MSFTTLLEDSLISLNIFTLVDSSTCASDIVRALGHVPNGRRIEQVRRFLQENEVDISHWSKNGKVPTLITKKCLVCEIQFTRTPSNASETCGYSCSNTLFRSGKNNPNWKDNAARSYRRKALKHYGSVCTRCGFSDDRALHVHHIDKNRSNNTIPNLEVLCANCHNIEHYSN